MRFELTSAGWKPAMLTITPMVQIRDVERKLFKWIFKSVKILKIFHLKGISYTLDYFAVPAVEVVTRTTHEE